MTVTCSSWVFIAFVPLQAYGIPYRGGKPDDITVLVTYVTKTEVVSGGEGPAVTGTEPQAKL